MTWTTEPPAPTHDALRRAARKGDTRTCAVLLDAGANVHALGDDALRAAVRRGHIETVRVLLAAGANVHAHRDIALYDAAENGDTDVASLLLAAGADPVMAVTHGDWLYPAATALLDHALVATQSSHLSAFCHACPDTPLPEIDAYLAAHDVRTSLQRPARGPCPTPPAPRLHTSPRASADDDLDH